MKIQFIPGIDTQLQQILRNDLAAYESRFDLSDEEQCSLYEWVSEGNAVCDNPWYMASENGAPMDFVTAMRTVSAI